MRHSFSTTLSIGTAFAPEESAGTDDAFRRPTTPTSRLDFAGGVFVAGTHAVTSFPAPAAAACLLSESAGARVSMGTASYSPVSNFPM